MHWQPLKTISDYDKLMSSSFEEDFFCVAIFKHSTRCAISKMAQLRLVSSWDFPENKLPIYYLDLLAFRELSDKIATDFSVEHQSPQLLLIKNGKCIFHTSHTGVSANAVKKALELKA